VGILNLLVGNAPTLVPAYASIGKLPDIVSAYLLKSNC
jgi:hypothetical protein